MQTQNQKQETKQSLPRDTRGLNSDLQGVWNLDKLSFSDQPNTPNAQREAEFEGWGKGRSGMPTDLF